MKLQKLIKELDNVTEVIPVVVVSGNRSRYLNRDFMISADGTLYFNLSKVYFPALDTEFLKLILKYADEKVKSSEPYCLHNSDFFCVHELSEYDFCISWELIEDRIEEIEVEDIAVEERELPGDVDVCKVLTLYVNYLPKDKGYSQGYENSYLKKIFYEKVGEDYENYHNYDF